MRFFMHQNLCVTYKTKSCSIWNILLSLLGMFIVWNRNPLTYFHVLFFVFGFLYALLQMCVILSSKRRQKFNFQFWFFYLVDVTSYTRGDHPFRASGLINSWWKSMSLFGSFPIFFFTFEIVIWTCFGMFVFGFNSS